MKVSPRVTLLSMGKATAVTVAMCLCMAIFPLSAVVLVPFLPLPTAYMIVRHGVPIGCAVTVLSGVLVFGAVGVGIALPAFLVALGVGVIVGLAVRRTWTFGRSLALAAAAALGAFSVSSVALWFAAGLTVARAHQAAEDSIASVASFYTKMGVGTQTIDSVTSQLKAIVHALPYVAAGLAGMGAVLLAACALGLAYWLFPRGRDKVAVGLSLSGFRMHWGAAYASIAGLALLVFARVGGGWHSALLYLGIDVLLVSQTLFFVQGLAVARWFTTTRQLRPGSRSMLFIAAILAQAVLQLTGLVGLLDTWLDYRRRYALKPGNGPGEMRSTRRDRWR